MGDTESFIAGQSSTLEELQTSEQRILLDTVTRVRKCGLDSILSLPQIVVCGDQSSGKSSVLEALTEIPFPRNDNLCTRFATEISLRRESVEKFTVKIVPDSSRPQGKQDEIKGFSESLSDLSDLPVVMEAAMKVMGITGSSGTEPPSAFARDTLSIEVDGPNRPQLTLVDIPGLIQASTKGVSDQDVAMVKEITDHYISQPRTICLAVISATNDAANQGILQQVRSFDRKGERTLGVITKPDKLEAGSGSEAEFLALARNENVFFELGWHVVKNRTFDERDFSFEERNSSEINFFRTSNFKTLPQETVGINTLRVRLSRLLYSHVKNEIPHLMGDLEVALESSRRELGLLGSSRSTAPECRAYLTQLSMDCHEICKAALNGHYEHQYFRLDGEDEFSLKHQKTVARLRATVQLYNNCFAELVRTKGHKYKIPRESDTNEKTEDDMKKYEPEETVESDVPEPKKLSKSEATKWVQKVIIRSRGTELFGSYNPSVVAELFWEQSQPWPRLAKSHIECISQICERFLAELVEQKGAKDVVPRIWISLIKNTLREREKAARDELDQLIDDMNGSPINYNHYYTQTVQKARQQRLQKHLGPARPESLQVMKTCKHGQHYESFDVAGAFNRILSAMDGLYVADMDKFSCRDALDSLLAIYKVQQKVFIANVTTQVIERQMLRGLDLVFSPHVVAEMSDADVVAVAMESPGVQRQRTFLKDRVSKLEEGQGIFRSAMRSVMVLQA
ncbi:hypothetical protein PspLS_08722 [Pyricularia sp. CBS 133598]|nr:hypothetical protein PspLS_08722 [Pyricularia sp. CBS 133598]